MDKRAPDSVARCPHCRAPLGTRRHPTGGRKNLEAGPANSRPELLDRGVALRPVQRMSFPLQKTFWEVPVTIAMKLVLHPLVVLLLLSLLGPFETSWVYTAVLMAALPPALNVFIMARQYDTWVAQASGAVLFWTFVSVVTLTTTMWLVKTGHLPGLMLH